MLTRNADDLFHYQLRRFTAAVLVDVKSVSQLCMSAIRRSSLPEGDRVEDLPAIRKPNLEFQVAFTDCSLFDNLELAAEYRRPTGRLHAESLQISGSGRLPAAARRSE